VFYVPLSAQEILTIQNALQEYQKGLLLKVSDPVTSGTERFGMLRRMKHAENLLQAMEGDW
jgi:hypothetical protein